MNVFVTGANGFVGSAVVEELAFAGHRVVGLVRSDRGARAVEALGGVPHRGALEDPASLAEGARAADAIVHTAFNHDFSRFAASCAEDQAVIAALADAIAGSARPLVVTSALGVMPAGVVATEDTAPGDHPRAATDRAAALAAARANVSVLRLPPSTHGEGDPHFVPTLIAIARRTGMSVYADEGRNRWPAVHRRDAARLYRLAVESALPGARYHAAAEEGIPFVAIATAIGRGLSLPVVKKTREEAAVHFGGFARFAALDVPASSAFTRARLGWEPREKGLLEDLADGHYFR